MISPSRATGLLPTGAYQVWLEPGQTRAFSDWLLSANGGIIANVVEVIDASGNPVRGVMITLNVKQAVEWPNGFPEIGPLFAPEKKFPGHGLKAPEGAFPTGPSPLGLAVIGVGLWLLWELIG